MRKFNYGAFVLMALSLFASGVFISCSSEEDPTTESKDWKWKKIVRSNINKAQYLFNTPTDSPYSASSRTFTDHSGFGAIDINGMVKDIQFFNEDGELIESVQPTLVHGIAEVGKEYVICGITLFQDIKYEGEDGEEGMSRKSLFCNLLINKKTGKVYMIPNKYDNEAWRYEPSNSLIDWYQNVKGYSDAQGNLYLGYYDGGEPKISKINIQDVDNIYIEDYLPLTEMEKLALYMGDKNSPFIINASGVCAYSTYPNSSNAYNKFKCPGGRIYPIQQLISEGEDISDSDNYLLFLGFNGCFYIATYNRLPDMSNAIRIYKLTEPTNNEIESEKIAELIIPWDLNDRLYIKAPIGNPEKHTHFWSSGGKLVEFSEDKNTLIINTAIKLPELDRVPYLFYTSSAVYVESGSSYFQRLTKISLSDYSDQKIIDFQKEGYEAYNITSSFSSPNLSFTGLRYLDANYIIGSVDDVTGNINCLESTAFINEKTVLIPMN